MKSFNACRPGLLFFVLILLFPACRQSPVPLSNELGEEVKSETGPRVEELLSDLKTALAQQNQASFKVGTQGVSYETVQKYLYREGCESWLECDDGTATIDLNNRDGEYNGTYGMKITFNQAGDTQRFVFDEDICIVDQGLRGIYRFYYKVVNPDQFADNVYVEFLDSRNRVIRSVKVDEHLSSSTYDNGHYRFNVQFDDLGISNVCIHAIRMKSAWAQTVLTDDHRFTYIREVVTPDPPPNPMPDPAPPPAPTPQKIVALFTNTWGDGVAPGGWDRNFVLSSDPNFQNGEQHLRIEYLNNHAAITLFREPIDASLLDNLIFVIDPGDLNDQGMMVSLLDENCREIQQKWLWNPPKDDIPHLIKLDDLGHVGQRLCGVMFMSNQPTTIQLSSIILFADDYNVPTPSPDPDPAPDPTPVPSPSDVAFYLDKIENGVSDVGSWDYVLRQRSSGSFDGSAYAELEITRAHGALQLTTDPFGTSNLREVYLVVRDHGEADNGLMVTLLDENGEEIQQNWIWNITNQWQPLTFSLSELGYTGGNLTGLRMMSNKPATLDLDAIFMTGQDIPIPTPDPEPDPTPDPGDPSPSDPCFNLTSSMSGEENVANAEVGQCPNSSPDYAYFDGVVSPWSEMNWGSGVNFASSGKSGSGISFVPTAQWGGVGVYRLDPLQEADFIGVIFSIKAERSAAENLLVQYKFLPQSGGMSHKEVSLTKYLPSNYDNTWLDIYIPLVDFVTHYEGEETGLIYTIQVVWSQSYSPASPIYLDEVGLVRETSNVQLSFPARGSAYTTKVTAVIDHDREFYTKNRSITLYNGLRLTSAFCKYYQISTVSVGECADYHFSTRGYLLGYMRDATGSDIELDFAYDDDTSVTSGKSGIIWYDGHSGYDYAVSGSIYPAAPGILCVAVDGNSADGLWRDNDKCPYGNDTQVSAALDHRATSWDRWHAFYIKHEGCYSTWYLHAESLSAAILNEIRAHGFAEVSQRDVDALTAIGTVGNWGLYLNESTSGGEHLHFELRCDNEVIDPYGDGQAGSDFWR